MMQSHHLKPVRESQDTIEKKVVMVTDETPTYVTNQTETDESMKSDEVETQVSDETETHVTDEMETYEFMDSEGNETEVSDETKAIQMRHTSWITLPPCKWFMSGKHHQAQIGRGRGEEDQRRPEKFER
ncbi:unnamed protein product [Eruca vesicaria subsp. sativa]|uniref:L27 domain-containing protein n=1 Tax=Eruca vesicaria subsp. sativa TaxID=29727 RepID=A0ABC8KBX6_ERUVS|nr:unnamed protein product [Eruca vesicaria subsp. sativa]